MSLSCKAHILRDITAGHDELGADEYAGTVADEDLLRNRVAFTCLYYQPVDGLLYCGITAYDADIFYTFDPAYDSYDAQYAGLYGQPHPPEAPPSLEIVVDWLRRTWDLVDRFQPDLLYFDFGWQADEFRDFRPKIFSYYYNRALEWGKDVLVNF